MVQALTDALELRGFQVMVGQVGYASAKTLLLLVTGGPMGSCSPGSCIRAEAALADGLGHSGGGNTGLHGHTLHPTCSSACAMKRSAPRYEHLFAGTATAGAAERW